ncbi:claudin-34-like [Pseudophryne corroboree]|uniref:claudin-34-like n=1 Tax=Pseudophryne corroboree TaxID=495146 RepID=UPI00308147B1
MPYLAHTANLQLAGFFFATVGWVLGSITTGLVQWRVWYVANTTIITSGIAWIGIWRTCFFSHVLVSPNLETMYCQEFSVTDSFIPREIFVAQGLMLVSMILGAMGKAACAYGLKNIYQGLSHVSIIPYWLTAGGFLYVLSSISILISVAWNMNSVVSNSTIAFPSTFSMPSSPQKQEVGAGISLGIVSAIVLFISGIFFFCYKLPPFLDNRIHPINWEDPLLSDSLSVTSGITGMSGSLVSMTSSISASSNCEGIQNEAFVWETEENL